MFKALFQETNPIGVKAAMGHLGWCSPEIRLPLTPMEPAHLEKLAEALRVLGVQA
jgi:4-hydroxy-tetrahydrodipicolinate synthase